MSPPKFSVLQKCSLALAKLYYGRKPGKFKSMEACFQLGFSMTFVIWSLAFGPVSLWTGTPLPLMASEAAMVRPRCNITGHNVGCLGCITVMVGLAVPFVRFIRWK